MNTHSITPLGETRIRSTCGRRTALCAAWIASAISLPLSAAFISFSSDSLGAKPNGFASADSSKVTFTDTLGANLAVVNEPPKTNGNGLAVNGDDSSALEINFAQAVNEVSFYFGNDDPNKTSEGDKARVTLFLSGVQVYQEDIVLNRNNAIDQGFGYFNFSQSFDRATVRYVNSSGAPINLAEYVDDVFFFEPPHGVELTTIYTGAKSGGDAVPVAGTDPRVEAGATFVKFGIPSENDSGDRAFVASWTAPDSKGTGIFKGNPETLMVALGDSAIGTTGTFGTLKDPMLNNSGRVAFIGKAKGSGVSPGDDSGIWSDIFSTPGTLALIAREGALAPNVSGGIFKSFKSVALGDEGIGFTAFMAEGPGGVTKDNDLGLWIDAGAGPALVAREGQALPEGTVKKFLALLPGALTRGHGNGVGTSGIIEAEAPGAVANGIIEPVNRSIINVRVLFTNGSQALYQATPTGLSLVAKTGDQAAGYDPGVKFQKFGIPGSAHNGNFAFLAKSKGPGVSGANGTSVNIWDDTDITHIVSNGDDASGVLDAIFKSFKDPACNRYGGLILPGKITGVGVDKFNDEGLWRGYPYGGLSLLAREGGIAPGTALPESGEHAVFGKFTSAAMTDSDYAVFLAKLRIGIANTSKGNDEGAWVSSFFGGSELILREGQQYDGKIVKKFALLSGVSGSSTQARSHSASDHLIMRVMFTDRSQALVDVLLPSGYMPN